MEEHQADKPSQLEKPAQLPAAESSLTTGNKWTVLVLVLLSFFCADTVLAVIILDLNGGPEDFLTFLFATLLGVCIGQLNLISTWAAIGPGKIVWRLPWTLLLAVLTWYAIVLGCRIAEKDYPIENAYAVGVVLLAGILVGQLPLWIAGKFFGWQLLGWDRSGLVNQSESTRYGLKHILIGMVMLSLAMAPARAVLPAGQPEVINLNGESLAFVVALAISNLIICLPCIWGAFASSKKQGSFLVIWPAYCAVVTLIEFGGLVMVLGPPGDSALFVGLVFYCMNISQCLTVYLTLLIFKGLGCRLTRVERGIIWLD